MNEKVLVTGGAGYIGSSVVRHLLIKGYDVHTIDNCSMGSDGIFSFIGYPNYTFYKGDIRNLNEVRHAMKNIDYVVHLAAIVGEPACRKYKHDAKTINIDGSKNVFNLSQELGVKRFIFFSTCSSYGVQDTNIMADENTELNPVSLYAETKIEIENYIKENISSDSCFTILRPSTVHGPSPRMRFDLIVNHFVKDSILNGELEIFGGSLWRPLMWVGDAGRAIEKVLISKKELIYNEIFNMGNTESNFQKIEIANIIKNKFLQNLKIISHKEDSDLRSYKVDFSKIKQKLDFNLEKSLEQSIEELIYICNHKLIEDYNHIKYRNH